MMYRMNVMIFPYQTKPNKDLKEDDPREVQKNSEKPPLIKDYASI